MTLSAEQVEQIRGITDAGITIATLRDDILDHLCCQVEGKMAQGSSFESALAEALIELAPNGLAQIQADTINMLQSKNLLMKKFSFVIGAICAISMGIGCVLSLLNFPAGHMIFGLAAFTFIIFFVPLDAIRYLRSSNEPLTARLCHVFNMSSIIILATGVMSRILFLPGANEMIVAGLILFAGGFLPLQFFRMYKESFS
jgi:hypothetical protein